MDRTAVPVQRSNLLLPIPLLPLWTVQPVQSLSACTTVHFTFTYTSTPPKDRTAPTEPQCLYNFTLYLYLYLYSPYGPYSLYRASVPVQRCTLPLPVPLLPLWTIKPLLILSASTTVHFTFTYTSTPSMNPIACTEPQCLYNCALYLYLYFYSPYGPCSLYGASVSVQSCTLPLPVELRLTPDHAVLPWDRSVNRLSHCTTNQRDKSQFSDTRRSSLSNDSVWNTRILYNSSILRRMLLIAVCSAATYSDIDWQFDMLHGSCRWVRLCAGSG